MYISLAESLAKGFRRWSDAHQPCGNDNEGEVARLDALACAEWVETRHSRFTRR